MLVGALVLALPIWLDAQVEEEDLEVAPQAPLPALELEALSARFAEAEAIFTSADQAQAGPLFDTLIATLGSRFAAGPIAEPERSLLARSLSFKAQLLFNLGENGEVPPTLRQLLDVDSNATLDPNIVSPKLFDQFEALKKSIVGQLLIALEPTDAIVKIDDRPIDALSGPIGLLEGPRQVKIKRPGYADFEAEVRVEPAKTVNLDAILERRNPVLRLTTQPADAEVLIDGQVVGRTEESPGAKVSREFIIADVTTGLRRLEVRKPGYRLYRNELILDELIDYPMPPIALEQESGKIVLADMPAGAKILIDGRPAEPDTLGATKPSLTLPPGDHLVQVSLGPARMFSTRLLLADRQTVEIPVRLRPGLALFNVLGADRTAAEGLERDLRKTLAATGQFTLIDQVDATALPGLDIATLRALAAGKEAEKELNWLAVQKAAEQTTPALAYVLAVLGNDLVADEATLFIWSAGPGPSRPDRWSLRLADPGELGRLQALFEARLRVKRPSLGALLIDSNAAPHPVVFEVMPEGPAAVAGVEVGDLVLGLAGAPVFRHAELEERLLAAEPGEDLDLAVQGRNGARQVKVKLGSSPIILHEAGLDFFPSLAWVQLAMMLDSTRPEERWIIDFNQALLLLQSGDAAGAARKLRDVRAPQASHGITQATVDYFQGLALSRLDGALADSAKAAFDRAAKAPGARLHHHDGPAVAPRARLHLPGAFQ